MLDTVQDVTLVEAIVLLLFNIAGFLLTALAWRASVVDASEARAWISPHVDPRERIRHEHNRRVIADDLRHAELRRLWAHGLIALIGLFWLLTPQPVNPEVIWWAIGIRLCLIAVTLLLVEKTLHHLVARWRFDKPWTPRWKLAYLWPALVLAWRDAR